MLKFKTFTFNKSLLSVSLLQHKQLHAVRI